MRFSTQAVLRRFGAVVPRGVSLVLAALVIHTAAPRATAQADSEPQTIIVKMVDKSTGQWRFEPADIEVRVGDTVRFVQEDFVPHNVEFTSSPKGSQIEAIRIGPFLMAKGETYDVVVDGRFVEGTYKYVCTPHAPLGMKGSMRVAVQNTQATN